MNSARSIKGKVCATDVQQGLMPVQEVDRNIRPGAQILSSGSMQKDDSALNVLPAVQAVLSIASSLTRKMEVLAV